MANADGAEPGPVRWLDAPIGEWRRPGSGARPPTCGRGKQLRVTSLSSSDFLGYPARPLLELRMQLVKLVLQLLEFCVREKFKLDQFVACMQGRSQFQQTSGTTA